MSRGGGVFGLSNGSVGKLKDLIHEVESELVTGVKRDINLLKNNWLN